MKEKSIKTNNINIITFITFLLLLFIYILITNGDFFVFTAYWILSVNRIHRKNKNGEIDIKTIDKIIVILDY